MRRLLTTFSVFVLGVFSIFVINAEEKAAGAPHHAIYTPADIQWKDVPPSLPPGGKMAILEGNLSQPGPITFRLRVPDGYEVKPHFHPVIEHATVISGTWYWGLGEKFDKSVGHKMPAGTFAVLQPNNPHFVWAVGETEIQVHATGPWSLTYVNPADDPRDQKK